MEKHMESDMKYVGLVAWGSKSLVCKHDLHWVICSPRLQELGFNVKV